MTSSRTFPQRRPKRCDTAPEELNGPEVLEEIAREHWSDYDDLVGEQRQKFLASLKLAHSLVVKTFKGPCSRCGGTEFVKHGIRNWSYQCIRCRRVNVRPDVLCLVAHMRNQR